MEKTDRAAFAEALASFFAEYDIELRKCPERIAVWWGALQPYPIDDIRTAMALHLKDPDAGMYKPRPAHLTHHLERTIPEARRMAQLRLRNEYRDARRDIESRQLMLENDRRHNIVTEQEFRRRMLDLKRELNELNAIPKFAPLQALLLRGY